MKTPKKTRVNIVPSDAVVANVLAESVVAISKGFRALRQTRLNDRALLLLIQHAAPMVKNRPISQREVKAVLDGIASLEAQYLRKAGT